MTEYAFKNNAGVDVKVYADNEDRARELAMIELHGPMTAHDKLLFGPKWIGKGLYLN
jgi:hypothetical protein